SAAGPGDGDDIGEAVAVDVAGRHANAAQETRVVGQEVKHQRVRLRIVNLDVGAAAGAGAGCIIGHDLGDLFGRHGIDNLAGDGDAAWRVERARPPRVEQPQELSGGNVKLRHVAADGI